MFQNLIAKLQSFITWIEYYTPFGFYSEKRQKEYEERIEAYIQEQNKGIIREFKLPEKTGGIREMIDKRILEEKTKRAQQVKTEMYLGIPTDVNPHTIVGEPIAHVDEDNSLKEDSSLDEDNSLEEDNSDDPNDSSNKGVN